MQPADPAAVLVPLKPIHAKALLLRMVAALLIAFVVWHFFADILHWPLRKLVDYLRHLFFAGTIGAIENTVGLFVFPVRADPAAFGGKSAELLLEINPRLYTYGIPIFVALMLAARANARFVLLGLALLIPFQAWGVFFELLKCLALPTAHGMPKIQGLGGSIREFIVFGYQLGVLIFPTLLPVVLAAIFTRQPTAQFIAFPHAASPPPLDPGSR